MADICNKSTDIEGSFRADVQILADSGIQKSEGEQTQKSDRACEFQSTKRLQPHDPHGPEVCQGLFLGLTAQDLQSSRAFTLLIQQLQTSTHVQITPAKETETVVPMMVRFLFRSLNSK